jgi:hypothetical protein
MTKVEAAFNEELARALKDGFTADERSRRPRRNGSINVPFRAPKTLSSSDTFSVMNTGTVLC